jgi:hypothetical protein
LINTNGNTEGIFPSVNFRGILPTENIPLVYTEGITVGKKIKTKQKKNDDVSFLPTELLTEFIPSVNLLVKI